MKESTIDLIPIAGLCNRINAIMSAIGLCQKYESVQINVYWPKNSDCFAQLSDLFNPLSYHKLHNIRFSELRNPLLQPPTRKNLHITTFLRYPFYSQQYLGSTISNNDIEDILDQYSKVYIYSDNRFCKYVCPDLVGDVFSPISKIAQRVDHIKSSFSNHTVGIHVRRTDNVVSIKESPIEKFFALMDKEIGQYPDSRFYVASDSLEVKRLLVEKYDERIIQCDWDLNRTTVQGMQDAVAELYLLGSTCKIFGSKGSTFSTVASRIKGIPIVFELEG